MASLAIDPLNLIRVMPAEGRYEAYFLPCFPFLEEWRNNESISRVVIAEFTSSVGISSYSERASYE